MKYELLAPAGGWDSLRAAVIGGADSVYLGLNQFSARAKAENFPLDSLSDAVEYAHFYGVKIYVTLNTLFKDDELKDGLNCALSAWECGVDALIVQDLGLAQLIKTEKPEIVLHASTQMGIHNLEGALIAAKLGFDRIILSRETLLADIKKIRENTNLELEFFVQGALCIAFSGNCYFSSFAAGYSGNRGRCMQLCRKKYNLNGEKKYWLSAKDICMLSRLEELKEAGITSFKIEGRMRRAQYVGEAVRVYRQALSGEKPNELSLKKCFNRGNYCTAYLHAENDITDKDAQGHIGVCIGKVCAIKNKEAILSCNLHKGDGIKFFRRRQEVGGAVITADGNKTTFEGEVKIGDEVNITTDANLLKEIDARKRTVDAQIKICVSNSQITVEAAAKNIVVNQTAQCDIGLNASLTEQEIQNCFEKTEDFKAYLSIEIEGKWFIAKSKLNELRRNVYTQLKENLIKSYKRRLSKSTAPLFMSDIIKDMKPEFLPSTLVEIDAPPITPDLTVGYVIRVNEYSSTKINKFSNIFSHAFLFLPFIMRGKDFEVISEILKLPFYGVIVNNLYGVTLAQKYNKKVVLGPGFNIINSIIDYPKVFSYESDRISEKESDYTFVSGNVPVMTLCHCVKKSSGFDCKKCNGYDITITDESNRNFLLRHTKIFYCYGTLYNFATLSIESKAKNFKGKIYRGLTLSDAITKGNYGRGLI